MTGLKQTIAALISQMLSGSHLKITRKLDLEIDPYNHELKMNPLACAHHLERLLHYSGHDSAVFACDQLSHDFTG